MLRIILIFLSLTNLFVQPVHAQEVVKPADLKPLVLTGRADVLKVIDPQTLLLHDGRTIHLTGLHFPDFSMQVVGDYSLMAKKILEDAFLGETVLVYQTPQDDWGRMNRMGHHLAHLQRQSDKLWLQGLLISLGLAEVKTTQRTPELSQEMYALEKQARNEEIGLWSDPTYKILEPSEAYKHMDSFQIVEGHVVSAAMKNNRVFLNFGVDWREDFTASVSAQDRSLFNKQGINPLEWNQKNLRVRGWVRNYNGAFIEIDHPQAVEVLK